MIPPARPAVNSDERGIRDLESGAWGPENPSARTSAGNLRIIHSLLHSRMNRGTAGPSRRPGSIPSKPPRSTARDFYLNASSKNRRVSSPIPTSELSRGPATLRVRIWCATSQ
jgi:hypothetical protein